MAGFLVGFGLMLGLVPKDQLGGALGQAMWTSLLPPPPNKFYLQSTNNSVLRFYRPTIV